MKRSRLKWFIVTPLSALALVLGLLLLVAYSVLYTEPGARWLLSRVDAAIPGSLQVVKVEGNLGSGLILESLSFADDGLMLSVRQLEIEAGIDLIPLTIRLDRLRGRSVQVRETQAKEEKTEPAELEELLSSLSLPIAVEFRDLLVDDVQLMEIDGNLLFAVNSVAASGRWKDELEFDQMTLTSPDIKLGLQGKLGLYPPHALNLALEALVVGSADEDSALREIKADVYAQGELNNYELTSSAVVKVLDFVDSSVEFRASGDTGRLRISSLTAMDDWLDFAGHGELRWTQDILLSMESRIDHLQPSVWIPEWPDNQALTGNANFTMTDELLKLSSAGLRAVNGGMKIDGNGQIDLAGGVVAGQVSWKELRWPVGSGDPEISSSNGGLTLSGTPDDWQLSGSTSLESRHLPKGDLQIAAQGNRECARLTSVSGAVLGGEVSGSAHYCWSEQGSFSALLNAKNVSTGPLLNELPGTISLDLETSGRLEPLELAVDLRDLNGTIRELPVNAAGHLRVAGEVFQLDNVLLRSGDAIVELNGSLESQEGIQYRVEIGTLGSLIPGTEGSISGHGLVSFHSGEPRIRADVYGQDLSVGDFTVNKLEIHNGEKQRAGQFADLKLTAEQLIFSGQALEHLKLGFLAIGGSQELQLELRNGPTELSAALKGRLDEESGNDKDGWRQFFSMSWSGEFDRFDLSSGERLAVHLISPAPLELSFDHATVSSACLTAGDDSLLCVAGDWSSDGRFSSAVELQDIPLQLGEPFVESGFAFGQSLSGLMEWRAEPGLAPSGKVELVASPGEIRFLDETDVLLRTGAADIAFVIEEGHLKSGNFDMPLPGNGLIDLDLGISNIATMKEQDIDGRLHVVLEDLSVFADLVPGLDVIGGKFESNMRLGGTLTEPVFAGHTSLADGVAENGAMGLYFSNIQLSGETIRGSGSRLHGSFSAHEGSGEIIADLDFTDLLDPHVDLLIRGENLTLIDAPDLRVVAEPDIQLGWRGAKLIVDGSLGIPSARIAPGFIPSRSASESADRVIVAGEDPTLAEEEQVAKVSITGDLDIILGDDVEVDLSVAVAQLNGRAKFTWQDELIPLAGGDYTLTGQIQVLGQVLRITEGVIGWPGSPADNPHLAIRAERQIYGNSEVRRAGVFLTGTLRRPIIEPFTEPMTNRERARTLLVTGSDFNMERGVGAVDVGTYIGPRLFVSYGIGLFEDGNVISVRYDLGRNWGVKATSGQRGTGLDMSYTIDR